MKIAFRTDASIQIGTGHVMRCLTLADALKKKGAQCEFICRELPGHLIEYIRDKGYIVHSLALHSNIDTNLAHSQWLGATQAEDAQACVPLLAQMQPDWLVVDHYALDARWESMLLAHSGKVMVIDDLADRTHACQLLLDQTFGRSSADYRQWVPSDCTLLCGSNYALLRPEFEALRPYSLQRRAQPRLQQLLVTLGGVDKDNITTQVLNALLGCPLPSDCEITVVMGATAPWLAEVQQQAQTMPWSTTVRVGINTMAQLMAESDLAIGAAGATSWERCCLGLPTIIVVLAENQRHAAILLERAGAASLIPGHEPLAIELAESVTSLKQSATSLHELVDGAKAIADGMGTLRVLEKLFTHKEAR